MNQKTFLERSGWISKSFCARFGVRVYILLSGTYVQGRFAIALENIFADV